MYRTTTNNTTQLTEAAVAAAAEESSNCINRTTDKNDDKNDAEGLDDGCRQLKEICALAKEDDNILLTTLLMAEICTWQQRLF